VLHIDFEIPNQSVHLTLVVLAECIHDAYQELGRKLLVRGDAH
jgi:hypothetical protein